VDEFREVESSWIPLPLTGDCLQAGFGEVGHADADDGGGLGGGAGGVPGARSQQRARAGDKGRDDRRFLEALRHFAVHNITWWALPPEFAPRNSVWMRFWRLSRSCVFEAFFQALAGFSRTARLVQIFDSTELRVHVSAADAKGGKPARRSAARAAASGPRPPEGDFEGLPLDFHLTGGRPATAGSSSSCSDRPGDHAEGRRHRQRRRREVNSEAARQRGIRSVIPCRSNAKERPASFPKGLYRGRARIKHAIGKLKRFKRVALRCEKTADNYAAIVAFVCALILGQIRPHRLALPKLQRTGIIALANPAADPNVAEAPLGLTRWQADSREPSKFGAEARTRAIRNSHSCRPPRPS
jgi:hypothetical protein